MNRNTIVHYRNRIEILVDAIWNHEIFNVLHIIYEQTSIPNLQSIIRNPIFSIEIEFFRFCIISISDSYISGDFQFQDGTFFVVQQRK